MKMKRKLASGLLIVLMAIVSIGAMPGRSLTNRYETNPNNSCSKCPRPTWIEPSSD